MLRIVFPTTFGLATAKHLQIGRLRHVTKPVSKDPTSLRILISVLAARFLDCIMPLVSVYGRFEYDLFRNLKVMGIMPMSYKRGKYLSYFDVMTKILKTMMHNYDDSTRTHLFKDMNKILMTSNR